MLSFIIPAHDEELLLGATLGSLHAAAVLIGASYEVVVVDDASTDSTASIAAANGARVISVNHRKIGAARNAGAQHATGALLIFVDADTIVPLGPGSIYSQPQRSLCVGLTVIDRHLVEKASLAPFMVWWSVPY